MSDMRVKTCVLGAVSTNCYLVYNEGTKKAVIVDPADNAQFILNKCNELGITPEAILLTHGHLTISWLRRMCAVHFILRFTPLRQRTQCCPIPV